MKERRTLAVDPDRPNAYSTFGTCTYETRGVGWRSMHESSILMKPRSIFHHEPNAPTLSQVRRAREGEFVFVCAEVWLMSHFSVIIDSTTTPVHVSTWEYFGKSMLASMTGPR